MTPYEKLIKALSRFEDTMVEQRSDWSIEGEARMPEPPMDLLHPGGRTMLVGRPDVFLKLKSKPRGGWELAEWTHLSEEEAARLVGVLTDLVIDKGAPAADEMARDPLFKPQVSILAGLRVDMGFTGYM